MNTTVGVKTLYAAYAPHKDVIDEAIYLAAQKAAAKIGNEGFANAFCKTNKASLKLAA